MGAGSPAKVNAKVPQTPKRQVSKIIKDTKNDEIQFLGGQFKAHIKLNKFDDDDKDKEKAVYTYE